MPCTKAWLSWLRVRINGGGQQFEMFLQISILDASFEAFSPPFSTCIDLNILGDLRQRRRFLCPVHLLHMLSQFGEQVSGWPGAVIHDEKWGPMHARFCTVFHFVPDFAAPSALCTPFASLC